MPPRIRLGVIGANADRSWAAQAHFPAVRWLPRYEVAAVCTSKPETAAAAAKAFGARHAFHDHRQLIAHPEVDVVVVSVKAPMHHGITMAALQARKPVITEWPLGANLAETEEMAAGAAKAGVPTMVVLQGRAGPAILYLKELIETGYVGRVLSCFIYRHTPGQGWTSENAWVLDRTRGGHSLSIHTGHTLDTMASMLGEFKELSAYVRAQNSPVRLADTKAEVAVTSPDHVLVQGVLESGALATVHVGSVPGFATGGRLEVYGTEGMLLATATESLHRGDVTVMGSRGGEAPKVLPVPDRHRWVPAGVPKGPPLNVAQLYFAFAQALDAGKPASPDFEAAARRYRLLDAIARASDTGRRITPKLSKE